LLIFRLLGPLLLIGLAWWGLLRVRQHYSLTKQQFRWLLALTSVLVLVLALILMGRLPVQAVLAPIIFLLTFAMRNAHWLMQLASMLRLRRSSAGSGPAGSGGRRSGSSTVKTDWLAMELQHSTGAMDGRVLQGQFQGKRLSQLGLPDLLELAQESQDDADTLQLLEAYLDRMHPDWREQGDPASGQTGGERAHHDSDTMSESLALEILGLETGATREEIVAAHRRLMQKLHPDRGGSPYLAQRLNEARDVLLGKRA
tara:strand:+ start:7958 stop:8728 length:771 start_codon:yes stop_codon:yes gene_type:complete